MESYHPSQIRNIALTGHTGAGKTSLAEAMLSAAGVIGRAGSVDAGNTVCDFDPEEVRRRVSISCAAAPLEWKGCKLNLLDTPGLFDFEGAQVEGLRAADSTVIVVSGKAGVDVGTEKAWRYALGSHMPRAFFVSRLDDPDADYYKVFEELKAAFGAAVCPVIVPFTGADGPVYVNLLEMKAYRYDGRGTAAEAPMPESEHRLQGLITAVSEAVAETDDALFEKYFSGEAFSHDELVTGVHAGLREGSIAPVFCGSAATGAGVPALLDGIADIFPGADANPPAELPDGVREDGPTAALVFKTVADPFVGKLSYLRVYSGAVTGDAMLRNSRTGQTEKIGKLYFLRGKKQLDTDRIPAGDIGAAAKLDALTGDTLSAPNAEITLPPAAFPAPSLSMAVTPLTKGDEDKMSQSLRRLCEEDPTLRFSTDPETRQQILSGLGESHLEYVRARLKAKFGVTVRLEKPEVAYREAIRKKVKAEGKHKKQTGGHGQYGHVFIEFEPCDSEEMVFEEKVFGGAVPKNFFPAVEKGLRECVAHGVLAGYPVVHLKATLVDGSYHPVDSSEAAFKAAAALAFRAGLAQAAPMLLEPIGTLSARVPDACAGDIIGEINRRRGRVLGMEPAEPGVQEVTAEAPVGEMQDFSTVLRALTQGRGSFRFAFARYEEAPPQVAQAVIGKSRANSAVG